MKHLTYCLLIVFSLTTEFCFAVTIADLKPLHPRPFLMPDDEKNRILAQIKKHQWAENEFMRLQEKARQGDGYSAAVLYSLTGKPEHLNVAKEWLLDTATKGGDLGRRALAADKAFFDQGMPWLGDVYYQVNTEFHEAFDYVYPGLTNTERERIIKGINISADFRRNSMDTWWQTANLVFKPTSMVAIAGLVTQDPDYLKWGFFRKPGSSLGGYFPTLNAMLADNGPWLEAPIYAALHLPLYQSLKISDYLQKTTGVSWFDKKLANNSSVRGLMDYYINTTYPGERRGDGHRDYRILTYGDGATGQRGDYYLLSQNSKQPDLSRELALAYKLSKDPDYAAFLKHSTDYKPDLFQHPPLPASPLFPKAPSSVWPEIGLAFLRSDNHRSYWTNPDAIAASLLFRQGYGHGHADALSITLFADGELFYPDYNAIQYENPAVGWTTSSVAHNTVVVDGNNSLIANQVNVIHDFNDDFRFIQADVEEPLGLTKKRTLALTTDYLLDTFHLRSLVPRTYDYLLHSFGQIHALDNSAFKQTTPFSSRYKNIKNFNSSVQDDAWQLDFVIDEKRKRANTNRIVERLINAKHTEEQLQKEFGMVDESAHQTARLTFTMASQPATLVGIGEDEYGLSFVAARRKNTHRTTFVGLHSPEKTVGDGADNPQLKKLYESDDGVLIRVISKQYIDLHAIAHQSAATNLYDQTHGLGMEFTDYAMIRINRASNKVIHHGNLDAYSIAAHLADAKKHINHGNYQKPAELGSSGASALQINSYPEMLVLTNFAESTFVVSLTNTSGEAVSGEIFIAENEHFRLSGNQGMTFRIAPYQTLSKHFSLARYTQTHAPDMLPINIHVHETEQVIEHGLMVSAGPGLMYKFDEVKEPIYRIQTFDGAYDYTMRHGLLTAITDADNNVVYQGAPVFEFADASHVYSPSNGTIKGSHTWPNQDSASLIGELNSLIRWHIFSIQNQFYMKLDEVYTRLDEVNVRLDKYNPGLDFDKAVYLQQQAIERISKNTGKLLTQAVEIPFKDTSDSLCIKTSLKKTWQNTGQHLSFPLQRSAADQARFGRCSRGSLASWVQ